MKKYLIITILFFLIDRFIKYIAPSINIEGGFVKIGFYQNYSGAFSLPISGWLYNAAGIILLIIFIYLFYKEIKIPQKSPLASLRLSRSGPAPLFQRGGNPFLMGEACSSLYKREAGRDFKKFLAYSFIILGGASNIFDRLAYGYVIDYFNFFNYSFFNIADGMLIMGIAILIFGRQKMSNNKVQMPNQ